MSTTLANVTGVAVCGRALLIEGVPGSGKTSLALALIDRGAMLIGDDAVEIEARDGLLYAAPPAHTRGLIEVRNVGIVELPTCPAPVALLLVMDPAAPRFPVDIVTRAIGGVPIPLLPFRPGDAAQAMRAEYALDKHGLAVSP